MTGGPGRPVGGPAAQEAARAELAHPAYRHGGPGPLERLWHWLGARVDDLLSGGTGGHALLIVLVAVLAAGIVIAVRAGVPARTVRGPGTAADPLAPVAARDHRRRAQQCAADGRRAEAVREWLRAAIATVEERGVLPPRPGRTGAATAREAGPLLPAAAGELAAATAAFDEIWFGGREATPGDVARAEAAADAVAGARIVIDRAAPAGLAVPQ